MNSENTASQVVSAPTIQTELERVFKVLGQIEEKLFSPEPQKEVSDCPNDKMLVLREDIGKIANCLEKVNQTLGVLGK